MSPAITARRRLVPLAVAAALGGSVLVPLAAQADEPETTWAATVRTYDTGVENGYQLAFDRLNRTVYFSDAKWSTASRTVSGNAEDGYVYSDEVFTPGTGKLVEFDAATGTKVADHSFLGLTRNDGSGPEGDPWDWTTQSPTATSINAMRTTFSPYGVEVDGATTDATGAVDPTLITTTARQQTAGFGYGGGVVVYSASQGEPTDADRIWAYPDGSPVLDGPRRVAVNTETHRAYFTNLAQGRNGTTDGRPGYVTVVDTTKRGIDAVVAQVALPLTEDDKSIGVVGIAVDEEHDLVYVGTIGAGDGAIYVIEAGDVVESSSAVADHKATSFAANAGTVTKLAATAPLNARPTYDPATQRLYVASYASPQGTITVVDANPDSTTYGTVLDTIATGPTNAVTIDGERGLLYSAELGAQEVVVYSTDTHEELVRVPTSGNAVNVGIDPVTGDAWVSNFSNAGKTDVITLTEGVSGTAPGGATYFVPTTWQADGTFTVTGSGWKNTAGDTGSTIAVKLDLGVTAPRVPVTDFDEDVWAVVEADANGDWSLELQLPTLLNGNSAWRSGEEHTITFLTGSLLPGDLVRSQTESFTVVGEVPTEIEYQVTGSDGETVSWFLPVEVPYGQDITFRGEGWFNLDGDAGSGVSVLVNQGGGMPPFVGAGVNTTRDVVSEVSGEVLGDKRLHAQVKADDATGAWTVTIPFPTPDNSTLTEPWAVSSVQAIRLLTGAALADDTSRTTFGLFAVVDPLPVEPTFPDVPADHPFFAEIEWASAEGIVAGYSDGTFGPSRTVSRQAFAAFLHRLAGSPEVAVEQVFSDVPVDHPFAAAIAWAAAEGIVEGYSDGTFGPSNQVSRQAAAAYLYRYAGSPEVTVEQVFSDVPADHPFAAAIAWAAGEGVVTGYSDGAFGPSNQVSRQAAAAFLHRLP